MFVLDASALVSMFVADTHTDLIGAWLSTEVRTLCLLDFGAAEFVAVLKKARRSATLTVEELPRALADFDTWRRNEASARAVGPGDTALAEVMVRDERVTLSAPDALYIAIAKNDGATLVTFDARQAAAARLLGVPCVVPV